MHNVSLQQQVVWWLLLTLNFAITTDEVEERVDTVGNLEEESSSVGDSEEEETDPRVQQEVGEAELLNCTLKWELNIFLTVHKHFHMVVGC